MYNNAIKVMYAEFLDKCWTMGLSDTLVSTVAPFDNSTISEYRKEAGYKANCTTVTLQDLECIFEILKEFPGLVKVINPDRTVSNKKFWERRPELRYHFDRLRAELEAELEAELNTENIETQESVEQEKEVPITFVNAHIEVSTPMQRIEDSLKEIIDIALANNLWDIAQDAIIFLKNIK